MKNSKLQIALSYLKSKSHLLWFYLAGTSIFVGVILGFRFRTANGPDPIWIQAGAAVSLIFITWRYVSLTHKTLAEVEKSRLQSLVPVIVLRSRKYKHDSGVKVAETYLLNAGEGLAVKLRYSTSVNFPFDHDYLSDNPDLHPRVTRCFQGKPVNSFDALNPSHGNIESRITIVEEILSYHSDYALSNGVFGAIIVYEDKIGRGYCTLYIGNTHIFSELYPSDETDKKKAEIRTTLLTRVGGIIDVSMLVRKHGTEFWKRIISEFKDSQPRRRRR